MKYKVHRLDLKMTSAGDLLENFLNGLSGEIVAIIPNVSIKAFWIHQVNFILIVEKIA